MDENELQTYYHDFLFKEANNYPLTTFILIQQTVYYVSRMVFGIQVIYFLIKSHKLIHKYNSRIINFYSNLENLSIKWVKFLLYSMVITSISSVIFNIIGRSFFVENNIMLMYPSIIFSVLLFLIGLQGYMQNHTVVDLENDDQHESDIKPKNYNNSKLNEKLNELFVNESVYKNPDLKITHISEMLHTNRTYISKHINNEYSCSFSDFVNRYRVEEAKRLLTEENTMNYSLNYISEKSGFGSMGSFMRVFREMEGITPGQFRERKTL